jgi:hypothetical protein
MGQNQIKEMMISNCCGQRSLNPDYGICPKCKEHCEFEDEEECESCGEPATTYDSEGVPLCKGCFDELKKESKQKTI